MLSSTMNFMPNLKNGNYQLRHSRLGKISSELDSEQRGLMVMESIVRFKLYLG
jgi:hypothetical protein